MDLDSLARLADEPLESFKKAWEKVGKCFFKKGGKLRNRRLMSEITKQNVYFRKQSENANKRWRPPSEPRHSKKDAMAMPRQCSSSSSSSSNKTTTVGGRQAASQEPEANADKNHDKPYRCETPLEKTVCGWKIITGYEKEDRSWDKAHWPRVAKTAKRLLEFLGGDYVRAVDCAQDIFEDMQKKGLNCTIETVLKHSADWRLKNGKT